MACQTKSIFEFFLLFFRKEQEKKITFFSDSGQLLQQIVDEDVLDPFEDVGDGGKHPREDRLGDETHRLRKLVRQQRQQGRATTKASREQDEERQFFLWIDRQIVEER